MLPQALHLLDRREVYKTTQKINVPFARDTAFRVGVRWQKARLQQEGKRVGCLHKRWLALLLFVVLAILHNVLIGQIRAVGCSHKRGKGCSYKTTLCNLASGSFFWRVFLFCAVGAAL